MKSNPRNSQSCLAGGGITFPLFVLCAWLAAPASFAGTHTWVGGSASGLWSVPSNWQNSNPPFANESPLHLVFPSSATRRLSTNNIPNVTISSISFDGAAYTIAAMGQGTNVTFESSTGRPYWNIRVHGGTGHTLHHSLGIVLDGDLECNIAGNSTVIVRSTLRTASRNSGLFKDGPGMLILDPIQSNTSTARDLADSR